MITQINVVVHNTMLFLTYLDHQVKKQIHWNIVNRTNTTMQSAFSSIGFIQPLILNMVIDRHNEYNEPYDDISMDEYEVDWD